MEDLQVFIIEIQMNLKLLVKLILDGSERVKRAASAGASGFMRGLMRNLVKKNKGAMRQALKARELLLSAAEYLERH